MALKSIKYIQIDDQEGILYSAQQRVLIVPVTFVRAISSSLSNIFGPLGAKRLIYELGKSLGSEFVKTLESILKEERITLDKEMYLREVYNAIFMSAGWGRVEFYQLNLEKEKIILKISNCPSGEEAQESDYALERGILAGCYKEIIGREVYYQTKEKEDKTVIFQALQEIPEKILTEGEMALLGRKELEKIIKEKTKKLQERVEELERFHKLTVGRELRMIELKEEIKNLKKQLEEKKTRT